MKLLEGWTCKSNTTKWHLENLDHITRVITSNTSRGDTDEALKIAIKELRSVFNVDCVWLIKHATEHTEMSLYSSSLNCPLTKELNKNSSLIEFLDIVLSTRQPITYAKKEQLPSIFLKKQIKSVIAVSLQTQIGNPWVLGMHQRATRTWSKREIDLFADIALRIKDILTILLLFQQSYKLAHYDSLTELPNRLMFQTYSKNLIETAKDKNTIIGVFLIDLDDFKLINDTKGHQVGDYVLKQIANNLKSIISDQQLQSNQQQKQLDHGYMIARLGGDEFVMIVENINHNLAQKIGALIVEKLRDPIFYKDIPLIVSASVGISLFPTDGIDMHQVLKAADLAMYSAKEHGKNQFAFHNITMISKIETRIMIESVLRDWILKNDIELKFQPITNILTGKIIGAEALLHGIESATITEVIEIAEQTNLIVPLGLIILRKACEFIKTCVNLGIQINIAVNISAQQIKDPQFAENISKIIKEVDISPTFITLELTETILIQNFKTANQHLNTLRKIGISTSIDDFGKGYSSFTYLQLLTVQKIKIDMSFTHALGTVKGNEITKAIILMANALGVPTCAEGVETKQQLQKLKQLGCDEAQGRYKHHAMSDQQLLQLLKKDSS